MSNNNDLHSIFLEQFCTRICDSAVALQKRRSHLYLHIRVSSVWSPSFRGKRAQEIILSFAVLRLDLTLGVEDITRLLPAGMIGEP